jgi:phosphoribosylaminoimidazole-succinocarboxamide synthase
VPTLGSFTGVLDLPRLHVGKVRELYAYGLPEGQGEGLLMVATDRISAFDFVLDSLVPDKGAVLTQLSQWWFAQLDDIIDNHVLSEDVPDPVLGRAVVCERLDMVPVECVARGYLTGSGWAEYQQTRSVCGVPLPEGLVDGSRLPEPIFTPATKAAFGEHDENVDFETMVATTGRELGEQLRDVTLAVYARAEEIARARGLILADTKIELGRRPDGTLVLADEVLTPDSSRYWDAATWEPGARLDAFDKQFIRDWLLHASGWDRASGAAPPPIPPDVVDATRERYLQAYERLTGSAFEPA